tara:strand:+ start:3237 stop:6095 length:2859 start_codon:yes stop_codon:yes gene_type:complete
MGKLINEWVTESILTEDIKKTVVTYVGRFHPFHSGHYATYSHLVKKFGKDNVYIGTSDKVELPKSPFRFKEKVDIMSTMFGIPKNKIVQVKNPYGPKEILGKFDEDTTAFITVVGEKDKSRLGGKYFQPYKGEPTEGYRDRGYVYVAPSQSSPLSGTAVRKGMSDSDEKNRIKFFKKAYPKFNQKIFDLVSGRLIKVESVMESFLQTFDIKEMLSEASSLPTSGKGIVDDGPGAFYGNMKTFKKEAEDVTTALGWEIVSYLMDDDSMESFDTSYPNGPGRYQVSFFPSGDTMDGQSIRYGKDVTGRPGYKKWAKHIKKVALRLGMEFVKFAEPKDIENLTQTIGTEKQKDKKEKKQQLHTEGVLNEAKVEVQVKKINISFELFDGTKISEDITLAMSPNSQGLFGLGDNIEKYSGLTLKDAQEYNETPDDAYIYGLVNTMNDGQDIFFWTNGTRLVGNVKKIGAQTAVIEQLAHEGVHLTRAILAKSLMGDGFPTEEWPSIGEQDNDTIEEEQLTTALSYVLEHITPSFIEMAKKYISKPKDKSLAENVLNEGGAYGHMNHPFDVDLGLTFSDLKIIIDKALNGKLEFTREKTDGQALAISWRADRGLIAARNKSHLKDRGLNALDIKGVSDKFANRGGLTDAYNFAMKDLENAIKGLSKAQREKVFKDGSKFMNIEVIWPESVNVIPYGQPLLVFHGTMEYDESGVAIGADTSDGRILAGMIKQVNADVQSKYTIQGPPVVTLPKNQELSKMKSKFFGQLSKIQKEFSLKDSAGVAEYHQKWWESFVDKNSPTTLDNKQKMGLVKRWAFYDKGLRLDKKVFSDEKTLEWAKKIDKQDHAKISKENIRKFEDIFLGVGSEVLSFMSSVLTVNPDKAIRDMKKRLDKTIKDVQNSGDSKKINKLKMELERLAAVGGKDKLVPNEGLVFLYKGHTMKLTGTFASLNQILGLMYF